MDEPILYKFYEDQYEYNPLRIAYDSGLNDYLATTKRGEKDREAFLQAGENLMQGLKSGRVTFNEGRYHDSQGEYKNSTDKNKHKDYYGIMANYIYNLMQQQKKYEKPEDPTKIKWDNGKGLATAFYRDIFNSDTPDWEAWNQLDTPETGTTNRAKLLARWLKEKASDASRFSDDYKVPFNLQEAITRLEDGSINEEGDWLALSRLGFDRASMFKDLNAKPQLTPEQQAAQTQQEQEDSWNAATEEASKLFPELSNPYSETLTDLDKHTAADWKLLYNSLALNSNEGIQSIISNSIRNKNYSIKAGGTTASGQKKYYQIPRNVGLGGALKVALKRGLLQQDATNPNLYLLPWTYNKDRFSYYVWNSGTNQIQEISGYNTAGGQQKINDYFISRGFGKQGTTPTDRFAVYRGTTQPAQQVASAKQGGVLKAAGGDKLDWRAALLNMPDFTDYSSNWDTSEWYNSDYTNTDRTAWGNQGVGKGTGRYVPAKGNSLEFTQGIENNQLYKNFTEALLDANGNFTEVGKAWAKRYDAALPENRKSASFYDENGNLRTSWTTTNNDWNGRPGGTQQTLAERVRQIRNDQILGMAHNGFRKTGQKYFWADDNGVKHWVSPDVAAKYNTEQRNSEFDSASDTNWDIYELTGLKGAVADDSQKDGVTDDSQEDGGSDVTRTNDTNTKSNFWNTAENVINTVGPDLMGAARLFKSLRYNNKIAKTLTNGIKPTLLNTYELYSPVTGAFSEMQFRNRQAANTNRLGARIAANTADASLGTAAMLDANRQAIDTQYAGFLADDKEIKRTQAEALKRQEDNAARRTDIANKNRAEINRVINEHSQIEADRLKSNWSGIDNFIRGLESRWRTNQEEQKALNQQINAGYVSQDYKDAVLELDKRYKATHPTTYDIRDSDPDYVAKIRELQQWRANQNYAILGNRYITGGTRSTKTLDQIKAGWKF